MRNAAVLVLAVAVLAGCALSPRKVAEVDARLDARQLNALTCPPDAAESCAAASPVLELGSESLGEGRHRVTLVEAGSDALLLRLHLIRSARRSIDLQNFILRRDASGELLLNELLAAARRGVAVRLLLDQMFSFSDAEYLVALTMAHGSFEIRFYNPSFHKAKMARYDWLSATACCFRRFNQRMHNKLMVVDGLVGIVGGRNIADRYFDLDTRYVFKDRDVAVFGPALPEMSDSFESFWNGPRTVPVQHLRDVAARLLSDPPPELPPYQLPERLQPFLAAAEQTAVLRRAFVEPAFEIERLRYFSDRPRKAEVPDEAVRDITPELYAVLESARRSIVIQSPYMVLSRNARKLFGQLRSGHPEIELVFSTNSLASTDADTVYGHTHRHKGKYIGKLGFEMYEFKPFPLDAPLFFPRWPDLIREKRDGIRSSAVVSGDDSTMPMPAPRVGLHCKSFVVDGRVAMIGSHNFDPRSEGFNTENGLVIWDEAFARKLEGLIRRDIEPGNSWVVAMRPGKEQAESALEAPPDKVTEFLPWFYGATSVYELAPGNEPVRPGSPDFYQHYYPVGSFPEVIRTRRQISVFLLGSFFFFLEPIL